MVNLSIIALAFSTICGIASADTTLGNSTRSTNATAFTITVSGMPQVTSCIANMFLLLFKYGYPLTQYISSLQPILSSIGANAIFHAGETAHANETSVVRPNVDTFYSIFAVDLSSNDVALTIPKVGDNRYYVVPFYDLSVDDNILSRKSLIYPQLVKQLRESRKLECNQARKVPFEICPKTTSDRF